MPPNTETDLLAQAWEPDHWPNPNLLQVESAADFQALEPIYQALME